MMMMTMNIKNILKIKKNIDIIYSPSGKFAEWARKSFLPKLVKKREKLAYLSCS